MRLLFDLDKKDYDKCTHTYVRNSARSIIIKDRKIAMVHSLKYDYYKFPGGGVEERENPVDAVIRETLEETGLIVVSETVKEYGYVHRIQKSAVDDSECFVQDNYYYFCSVENTIATQHLDDYESDECFTLEYVYPEKAIQVNREKNHGPKDQTMLEREARVLEILMEEGYFESNES